MALGTTVVVKRLWSLITESNTSIPRDSLKLFYEQHNAIAAFAAVVETYLDTHCIGAWNGEISTNMDVQNGDAFTITAGGVRVQVATDIVFDTGTDTVIATNAYWAAGIVSIDVDGTTGYVDWGAEAVSEAAAIALLSAVTATGDVVIGYFTVNAASGQDWVAGTDAITTGTGGQVAAATNYYNIPNVGDAAYDASAIKLLSTVESGD